MNVLHIFLSNYLHMSNTLIQGCQNTIIPNSVTSIGESAFAECSGLTSVTNYATTPQTIESDVFEGVDQSSCTLYVPEGSINLYQAAEVWKDFTNIQGKGDTPTAVENVQTNEVQASKFFRDGQLLIEKNGKVYTVTGQAVK